MELYNRLSVVCSKFSDDIALYDMSNDTTIQYSSLHESILKLVVCFSLLGIQPQEKVAFLFSHSKEFIISLFSVWALDAIFVPISSVSKIQQQGTRYLIGLETDLVSIDGKSFNLMDGIYCIKRSDEPCIDLDRSGIAYVIHTSGTTRNSLGGIKVTVPTTSFLDNLEAISERLQKSSHISARICPLVSETTFDPSLIEICLPLLNFIGNAHGSLVILKKHTTRMPQKFFDDIKRSPTNLLMMTPSLFMSLSPLHRKCILNSETRICDLVLGGETFPESIISSNQKQIRLWNIYGTTECSVWAFMNLVKSTPVSLGSPLGSTEWKIDNDNRMYLGGSKRICYINDEKEPAILRDTGDLVGERRSDSMIKRHGYRIHISQIAQIVQNLGLFQQYEIIYVHKELVDAIVCFYVGSPISDQKIQTKLMEYLPLYSIPTFYRLSSFPLSRHGKADIQRLKELYFISISSAQIPDSVSDLISSRLNINRDDLDITRHFLASGGSSFLAAMIIQDVCILLEIKQSPKYEQIKTILLNALFHDSISSFISLVESFKKNSQEPNKTNKSQIQTLTSSYKKRRTSTASSFNIKWKVNVEKCIDASPTVHENVLFIGSHSGLFVAIYCTSGDIKWSTYLPDRIEGTAALSPDGRVVAVGCYDHGIYKLCAATGKILSKFSTNGIVKACPLFDTQNNYIWIGSYDKNLYGIDLISNSAAYSLNLEGSIYSKCSVNYKTNHIIVSTTSGSVFSLYIGKGLIPHWCLDLGPIFTDPLLESETGDVFIGCTDQNLYRICGNSGDIIWKISLDGPIFSTPKFNLDRIILIGSHSSKAFCISLNGEILEKFMSDSPVFGSVVPLKNECIYASIEGKIYRASNTNTVDILQLPGQVFSTPTFSNSTIYIGCRDDHIYAITISH